MDIQKIADEIESRHQEGRTTFIAIDGIGGSGKSTFAQKLLEKLTSAYLIEMDYFYSPILQRQDWDIVKKEVLYPLKDNKKINFGDKIINPGGIIIIEGVYSMQEGLIEYYDFKILVDYDPQKALSEGLARSKERSLDEEEIWTNVWLPNELKYIETQRLHQKADLIIKGEKTRLL